MVKVSCSLYSLRLSFDLRTASSPLKQSHTLTSEFEPLDAPSIQATPQASSTSASTVELQRQLAQALARDRHAQESLKAGEEERTKLKRELEALETEWAAARAEAEEAMERAALVDPSREVELKRRIEALEGEMRKQKIKWNANFRFTELDHRYRQLADEMREEGGTYWIEVELIRQRGKAIIAEQEAFEQAVRLLLRFHVVLITGSHSARYDGRRRGPRQQQQHSIKSESASKQPPTMSWKKPRILSKPYKISSKKLATLLSRTRQSRLNWRTCRRKTRR